MTDITLDQIHAMIREHMEHETQRVIAQATVVTDFARAPGGISSVTAKDLIELQMDSILTELPSPVAIETLGHLQAMRSVAERIEMGDIPAAPTASTEVAEEAPKAKTTRRRKTKAQEPVVEATPEPVVEATPEPVVEERGVLESNQIFLTAADNGMLTSTPDETMVEAETATETADVFGLL